MTLGTRNPSNYKQIVGAVKYVCLLLQSSMAWGSFYFEIMYKYEVSISRGKLFEKRNKHTTPEMYIYLLIPINIRLRKSD